ncbi:ABC transporter ATP-binding protein/permease [Leifsonia sp. PS1209]|uniref:ABC transporter ATP-binding protein/permease n=1 Tax=Leifsonia sp. PS1209 TaxID=2724914 RepID=UPI001442B5C9|nr:ABC transporter ATP-binding protein/permease [Leifsonia sp. PS1209]QIZ99016.1 ATP-binding cassette domain-containing protein [Leifsonia sp. PS1209]
MVDPDVTPMVRIRALTKDYISNGEQRRILNDVDLDLHRGRVIALVGRSGSGKSSLLNTLGTLLSVEHGSVEIDGLNIADLSQKERASFRVRHIGFVFQAFHLIPYKTAVENVRLPLTILGVDRAEALRTAIAALESVGLGQRMNSLPSMLSGGEQQRVSIARALVANPRLLLCDEPTGNLDTQRADEVFGLLRSVTTSERCTVIVTHDRDLAARCDTVLAIVDGAVTDVTREIRRDREVTTHAPGPLTAGLSFGTAPHSQSGRNREHKRRGIAWRLAFGEAGNSLASRGARNVLTALGMVLGIAVLVTTSGLSATAAAQISDTFNGFLAHRITLTHETLLRDVTTRELLAVSEGDHVRRVSSLNGVSSVGVVATIPLAGDQEISGFRRDAVPERRAAKSSPSFRLMVASPSALPVLGAKIIAGARYDDGHQARGDALAMVGKGVMRDFGLTYRPGLKIFIGQNAFTVSGVLDDRRAEGALVNSVVLPLNVALDGDVPLVDDAKVLVEVQPGAAEQVGEESKRIFDPVRPERVSVGFPLEPTTLKDTIDAQTTLVMYIMSAIILVIGGVGIMNTYLVSVMGRRREIGLRLALGTTPRGILGQLALEALLLGFVGAVVGVVMGVDLVIGLSALNGWAPVIDPLIPAVGAASGVVLALLAGLYPAGRAARLDPTTTLSGS